ncbi:MAG: metal ABC transporter solute-binding protein, Zn/Mn family [Terrimicrobiaceae bacterium]
MKHLILAGAILWVLVTSARCAMEIVCTTGMVGDLVRGIAGDRARVTVLIGEGIDPHLFKPTRDDVAKLIKADIVFFNGLHLEGRMEDAFKKLRQRGASVTAVTSSIPRDRLIFDGHAEDPHVWMSPLLWAACGASVLETLTRADPDGADFYATNAARQKRELEALDVTLRKTTGTIPPDKRVLVTAHDAFQYFAQVTGLEVMSVQGLSSESEAGVADINRLVDEIVKRRIPAVFFESTFSEKNVRAVIEGAAARGHPVAPGGMLYADSLGPAGSPEATCAGMLAYNARTITQALGGEPAP